MKLSPVRLSELHSDLKMQEKDELQWKKMKVEGLDDNGEKEAQLRRNFNGKAAENHFNLTYACSSAPTASVTAHFKSIWMSDATFYQPYQSNTPLTSNTVLCLPKSINVFSFAYEKKNSYLALV